MVVVIDCIRQVTLLLFFDRYDFVWNEDLHLIFNEKRERLLTYRNDSSNNSGISQRESKFFYVFTLSGSERT